MAAKVKPIPEGYHSVTPYLVLKNTAEALPFYERAFGAKSVVCMPGPDGKGVLHAEIKIGDSAIMLSDEFPGMGNPSPQTLGGTTAGLHVYVENVDAAFERAVKAGAKAVMPPADMFWGDRFAKLTDPFGHSWSLATHIEDVSEEEMGRRGAEAAKQMIAGKPS